MSEPIRSRRSRDLAELALARIVSAYGATPEFVLLGGLVPDLLCAGAAIPHEGTTDVDVHVDLEIANGSTNAARLEAALRTAGFVPDDQRAWRWRDHRSAGMVVKAEFLADLDDVPSQTTVRFDACEHLGAINLRGTGFAARNSEIRTLTVGGAAGRMAVSLRGRSRGRGLRECHARCRPRPRLGPPRQRRRRRRDHLSRGAVRPLTFDVAAKALAGQQRSHEPAGGSGMSSAPTPGGRSWPMGQPPVT